MISMPKPIQTQAQRIRLSPLIMVLSKNIMRCLVDAGCDVTVMPATSTADEISLKSQMVCFYQMALATLRQQLIIQAQRLRKLLRLTCLCSVFVLAINYWF